MILSNDYNNKQKKIVNASTNFEQGEVSIHTMS